MINSQDLIFFLSFSLLENNYVIVAGKYHHTQRHLRITIK